MANTYFKPVMQKEAWRALVSQAAQPGAEVAAKRVKGENGTKQLVLYVRTKDAGLKRAWRRLSGVAQKRREAAKDCLFVGLGMHGVEDTSEALKHVRDDAPADLKAKAKAEAKVLARNRLKDLSDRITALKSIDGAALEAVVDAAFPLQYVTDGYLGPARMTALKKACAATHSMESVDFLEAAQELRENPNVRWADAEEFTKRFLLPTSSDPVNLVAKTVQPFYRFFLDCSSAASLQSFIDDNRLNEDFGVEEFLDKLQTAADAKAKGVEADGAQPGAARSGSAEGKEHAVFDGESFLEALSVAEKEIRVLLNKNFRALVNSK